MWPFLHPKPRPSLYLAVQLGAGLLVPMWVAPALAQGVAVITPSPAMAPRDEREKLAPLVMAPAAAEAMRAEQTANQLAWRESLKRMSEAEADDPSRALAAYKRFFNERTMSPALGVEVGLKIAQLRSKLGDSQGALQTCEVLGAKYADELTAALLSLQKARVLMESKQLAQASECVNEAMPELVALGPSRYREISDVLLQLVQANLDSDDAEGKERARALCVGVEEVYLRWLKGDTLPHTWQMFEALQTKYRQAGGHKRADELLPKAVDVLLQAKTTSQNPEGADVSTMAARWLLQKGDSASAQKLYARASGYGNDFVSQVALTDQGQILLSNQRPQEAIDLMLRNSPKGLEFGPQFVVAQAYWQMEDWFRAESAFLKVQSFDVHGNGAEVFHQLAQNSLNLLQFWKNKTFTLPLKMLKADKDENNVYHATLYVHSFKKQNIKVAFLSEKTQLISFTQRQSSRIESGLIVSMYEVSYSNESEDHIIEMNVTSDKNVDNPQNVSICSIE